MDPTLNPVYTIFLFFSPMLISILKQSGWPTQVNAMVAFACYIVVGIAGAIVSGEPVTPETLPGLIATATVIGTAAYKLIWSNIGKTNDSDVSLEEFVTSRTSIFKGPSIEPPDAP